MKKIEQLPPLFSLEPLEQRLKDISKVIEEKKEALCNAPEGCLRISMHGGTPQYYFRHKGGDFNGKYLSKPNESLVKSLAQKSYDKKILGMLEKEKALLEELLKRYQNMNPEDVILYYAAARRKLINPVTLPIEEYFIKWKPKNFPPNPYKEKPAFKSASGVFVRSKSEVLIADALLNHRIPFLYEFPIKLGDHRIYPDFVCLNPKTHEKIIWEHFGMLDDEEYANKFCTKMNDYYNSDFFPKNRLIFTLETSTLPLTPQLVEDFIAANFRKRVFIY